MYVLNIVDIIIITQSDQRYQCSLKKVRIVPWHVGSELVQEPSAWQVASVGPTITCPLWQ